jgi:hypothetical protein
MILCLVAVLAQKPVELRAQRFVPTEVEVYLSPAEGYQSIEELVKAAKVVVAGKVLGKNPTRWFSRSNPGTAPVTDIRIGVERVFKGSVDATDLFVTQSGGLIEGTNYITPELMDFQVEQQVLLFLIPSTEELKRPDGKNRFVILGLWAGCFAFDGARATTAKAAAPALREVAAKGRDAVLKSIESKLPKQ